MHRNICRNRRAGCQPTGDEATPWRGRSRIRVADV